MSAPVPAWLSEAIDTMGPDDVVKAPRGDTLSAQDARWIAEFLVEYEQELTFPQGR